MSYTFKQLIKAIESENLGEIKTILTVSPELKWQNNNNFNVLHLAVKTENIEVLHLILSFLNERREQDFEKIKTLLFQVGEGSGPVLALAVTKGWDIYKSIINFAGGLAFDLSQQLFILENNTNTQADSDSEGIEIDPDSESDFDSEMEWQSTSANPYFHPEQLSQSIKSPSKDGTLPIDIISEDSPDQKEINDHLLNLMRVQPVKPLDCMLDISDLLARYKREIIANPTLADHLNIACTAVNYVRRKKCRAYTHPQTNSLSGEAQQELYLKIQLLGEQIESLDLKSQDFLSLFHFLLRASEIIASEKVGNCEEINCYLLVTTLIQLGGKEAIEGVEVLNGGHVLIKYGPLFVDALLGEIVPVGHPDVFTKIKAFTSYPLENTPQRINVLLDLLPGYHSIESRFPFSSREAIFFPSYFLRNLKFDFNFLSHHPTVQQELATNNEKIKQFMLELHSTYSSNPSPLFASIQSTTSTTYTQANTPSTARISR